MSSQQLQSGAGYNSKGIDFVIHGCCCGFSFSLSLSLLSLFLSLSQLMSGVTGKQEKFLPPFTPITAHLSLIIVVLSSSTTSPTNSTLVVVSSTLTPLSPSSTVPQHEAKSVLDTSNEHTTFDLGGAIVSFVSFILFSLLLATCNSVHPVDKLILGKGEHIHTPSSNLCVNWLQPVNYYLM